METLIYILIGIAFFIFKVIQEAGKQKKDAASKRPARNPQTYTPSKEPQWRTETARDTTANKPAKPLLKPKGKVEAATSWEELRQVLIEAEMQKQSVKAPIESVNVEPISKITESEPEEVDEHLMHYKLIKDQKNPYGEILSDHDSLKKAFVLSEILKRRDI